MRGPLPILHGAMSVWLKVILIVFAAVMVNIGLAFVPRGEGGQPPPPSSSAVQKALLPAEPLLEALLDRPAQAAVDVCIASVSHASVSQTGLTHSDFVHIATCLHQRHQVSAEPVAAVKKSKLLGRSSAVATLQTKTETGLWRWLWLLTWVVALALIAVVVYRHMRRRPPGSVLRASG